MQRQCCMHMLRQMGGMRIRISGMKEAELIALWEEHTRFEFATRDVESTLATMIEDAHVNHVPVMTGGHGKPALGHSTEGSLSPACRRILHSRSSRARWGRISWWMR